MFYECCCFILDIFLLESVDNISLFLLFLFVFVKDLNKLCSVSNLKPFAQLKLLFAITKFFFSINPPLICYSSQLP